MKPLPHGSDHYPSAQLRTQPARQGCSAGALHVPNRKEGRRGPHAARLWEYSIGLKGSVLGNILRVGVHPKAEYTHMHGFFLPHNGNPQIRNRRSLRRTYPRFDGQIAKGTAGFPKQPSLKALIRVQFLSLEVDRYGHPLPVSHCYNPTASWCGGGRQHIEDLAKDRGGVHNNSLSYKRHNLKSCPDRYSPRALKELSGSGL